MADERMRPKEEAPRRKLQAEYLRGVRAYRGGHFAEAVKRYRAAADLDSAEGQYAVGDMYYMGFGVDQDFAEAEKWLRRAAEQDDEAHCPGSVAEYALATVKDIGAIKELRKAAEEGDRDAQDELTHCWYGPGLAAPGHSREVEAWYREAAERNDVRGRVGLAKMYAAGLGVAPDDGEAKRWLPRLSLAHKHERLLRRKEVWMVLGIPLSLALLSLQPGVELLLDSAAEAAQSYPILLSAMSIVVLAGAISFGVVGQAHRDLRELGYWRRSNRRSEGSGDLPTEIGKLLAAAVVAAWFAMNLIPAALVALLVAPANSLSLSSVWLMSGTFVLVLYARWLTSALIVYLRWPAIIYEDLNLH